MNGVAVPVHIAPVAREIAFIGASASDLDNRVR
jgi:hypothetical protein